MDPTQESQEIQEIQEGAPQAQDSMPPSESAPVVEYQGAEPVAPATAAQPSGTNKAPSDELYTKSPGDLLSRQINDSEGKPIGKIVDVVSSRQDLHLYTVVKSGGFLGIGASEYLLPIRDLTMKQNEIYTQATEAEVDASRTDYQPENYVSVKSEYKPLSEFSAFEVNE